MENDTLKLTENEDGLVEISWDKDDPKYAFLNGLTSAQLSAMMEEILRRKFDDESLLECDE